MPGSPAAGRRIVITRDDRAGAPRVVIAAPLYCATRHLEEGLASLLAQTRSDFALILVDDCSGDGTVVRAGSLARGDDRVEIHVNRRRLGLLENTRRAYALARERQPHAEFFALASDHDVWAPTWLEQMVAELDAHPEAVLAYPLTKRIDGRGSSVARPSRFETAGTADAGARLRQVARRMVAGDMVYGLFRASALARAGGPYRPVLYPDRLLLAELALQGEFIQVPDVLWTRRLLALPSRSRQRRALWPQRPPAHAYLPYSPVHAAAIARRHGVRRAAVDFLPASLGFELTAGAKNLSYRLALTAARPLAGTRFAESANAMLTRSRGDRELEQ